MDNASIHKPWTPFVAKGFKKLYAPPYSPDHNCPVENAFSKIKAAFRAAWPWDAGTGVDAAVRCAAEGLTAADIIASFRNLRHRIASIPL